MIAIYATALLALLASDDIVITIPSWPTMQGKSRSLESMDAVKEGELENLDVVADWATERIVDLMTESHRDTLAAMEWAKELVTAKKAAVAVVVVDLYIGRDGVRVYDGVRRGSGNTVADAAKAILAQGSYGRLLGTAYSHEPVMYAVSRATGGAVTTNEIIDAPSVLKDAYDAIRDAAAQQTPPSANGRPPSPSPNTGRDREADGPRFADLPHGHSETRSAEIPERTTRADAQEKSSPAEPTEKSRENHDITVKSTLDPSARPKSEPEVNIPRGLMVISQPAAPPADAGGSPAQTTGAPSTAEENILRELQASSPVATRLAIASALQGISHWGAPGTRVRLDANRDGKLDFCSRVFAGWIEAGNSAWRTWAWVPPGPSFASQKPAFPKGYVQVYTCNLSTPSSNAFAGDVALVVTVDHREPKATTWLSTSAGVSLCREFLETPLVPPGAVNQPFVLDRCTPLIADRAELVPAAPIEISRPASAQTPVWVNWNGDKQPNRCWIVPATNDQGDIAEPQGLSAQQTAAFQDLKPLKLAKGYVHCSNVGHKPNEVISPLTYIGLEKMRYWADIDGDGRDDFCRVLDSDQRFLLCSGWHSDGTMHHQLDIVK